jgi:hypothetical protein
VKRKKLEDLAIGTSALANCMINALRSNTLSDSLMKRYAITREEADSIIMSNSLNDVRLEAALSMIGLAGMIYGLVKPRDIFGIPKGRRCQNE